MSQMDNADLETLAKSLYACRGDSQTYSVAFQGWQNYLCDHVGYSKEDLDEAGEVVGENLGQTKSTDTPAEHVFIAQSLYSLLSVRSLKYRVLSAGRQLDTDRPLHTAANLAQPVIPSVFRWYDEGSIPSYEPESFEDDLYEHLYGIYTDLFPGEARKSLGEFYTPKWLAQYVLDRVSIDSDSSIIDPNCGAGVFLNELLQNRTISDPSECVSQIHGYEINPVSIVAAKCVYLDNLKEDLPFSQETRLPIYQVNSLLLPDGMSVAETSSNQMVFNNGGMENPREAALDNIENQFEKDLIDSQQDDTQIAKELRPYSKVVGNPPWISWENLGESARERIQEPLKKYGLVEGKVSVGALKIDSATLSLYLAADHLLEEGGDLGYVITESVFKAKSMAGFRRFELPDSSLEVKEIDDFTDIQPFEDATNRTGVITLERGSATVFPVAYRKWKKSGSTVPEGLEYEERKAFPIGGEISNPWIALADDVAGNLEKVAGGQDHYRPRVGINTAGGSGIYWVELEEVKDETAIVSNEHTAGRKDYPDMGSFEVEKEFLYPLVHGRHISRWNVEIPERLILVPHSKETAMKPISEPELRKTKLYSYLSSPEVKELLNNRRAIGNRWGGVTGEWYSLFEVGEYTFAPYKVVYRGQAASDIVAAVMNGTQVDGLGQKLAMPNQTAHFVPLWSEGAAHYVCGLLNSSPVRYLYEAFDYKHPGTFFIRALNIPEYDSSNEIHTTISSIAKDLSENQDNELADKLDKKAGELWDIPEDKIKKIQKLL